MEQFIEKHGPGIQGVVHGFDRVLFRGTLRSISYVAGMNKWLSWKKVLLKDFESMLAQPCTQQLKQHAEEALPRETGRPYQYLPSASWRKEDLAASIAERDGIEEGLVCVLGCVEPCMSFDVHRNRQAKKLELVSRQRKCKFYYFYFMDRDFGLMHVRLQSWLPCEVQVCLNGRSYLAQQMRKAGMSFEQRDNCFTRIEDLPRAQRMLDRLTKRNWTQTLNRLIRPCMPLLRHGRLLSGVHDYYWTVRQSEYATDVMFKDAASLAAVYPALRRHAIEQLGGDDILRFLGKKPTGRFNAQITSDQKRRVEGVRVKHRLGSNTIKMYDKQQSVLRIETTMNDPKMFRAFRRAAGDDQSPLKWRPLRKSVADIGRRVQVSRAANERYLEALSVVDTPTPIHRVLDPVSRPAKRAGRRVRALRPIAPDDAALFAAVMRGEHLLVGLSNANVRECLFPRPPKDDGERRRRSNYVSYRLRMLRRHGLIHKVPNRNLYRVTAKGHQTMTLALTLRDANSRIFKKAA